MEKGMWAQGRAQGRDKEIQPTLFYLSFCLLIYFFTLVQTMWLAVFKLLWIKGSKDLHGQAVSAEHKIMMLGRQVCRTLGIVASKDGGVGAGRSHHVGPQRKSSKLGRVFGWLLSQATSAISRVRQLGFFVVCRQASTSC